MEHAIKITLTNAFKTLDIKTYETTESLLDDLFKVLFPAGEEQAVVIPQVEPPKKKAAPRKKKEAEPPKPEPPKPAEPKPEEPKEKKKAAPRKKKEEAPDAAKANLEKLTPTQGKKLKQIAEELKVADGDKKKFLEYVNALSKEEYEGKKLDEHMRAFLEPKPEDPPASEEEVEVMEMTWKDKTYDVEPKTRRVFLDGVKVGVVGMGEFQGLEIQLAALQQLEEMA